MDLFPGSSFLSDSFPGVSLPKKTNGHTIWYIYLSLVLSFCKVFLLERYSKITYAYKKKLFDTQLLKCGHPFSSYFFTLYSVCPKQNPLNSQLILTTILLSLFSSNPTVCFHQKLVRLLSSMCTTRRYPSCGCAYSFCA